LKKSLPEEAAMGDFMRMNVKTVIDRFPEAGGILAEFGIGCVSCSVGTCLLSDVVEIHGLSAGEEASLLGRLSAVVSPGAPPPPARAGAGKARGPGRTGYSPPLKILVDEHVLIKRWLALVPAFAAALDVRDEEGRRAVLEGIDFIRSYADRFHHAKEEDLLFALFDRDLDILKAMREDHERGRGHVRGILEGLERRDRGSVAEHLGGYAAVLTEHIGKEDGILYPWMDRNLSVSQVGALFARFAEVDGRNAAVRERALRFVERMEERFLYADGKENPRWEVRR
jgi:hemerythrin-like domain-containing protein